MITNKDYKVKTLKLNTPLRGRNAGSLVRIRTDKNGIPLERYWRNRLKDSKIDNCVEEVKQKKVVKKKQIDSTDKGGN